MNIVISEREDSYFNIYNKCLKKKTKYEKQIKLDVPRTIINNNYFKDEDNLKKLENVLIAITVDNPDVGYLQGMNFIVGYFLIRYNNDEVKTFKTMSELLKNYKFGLKGLFTTEFPRLFLAIYQVEHLMKIYYFDIYDTLQKIELDTMVWITPWIFTLFSKYIDNIGIKNYDIIIDDFLINGWSTIIKIIMIMLDINRDQIVDQSYEHIMIYLNEKLWTHTDFENIDFTQKIKDIPITNDTLFQLEISYVKELTRNKNSKDNRHSNRDIMIIICTILSGILGTIALNNA